MSRWRRLLAPESLFFLAVWILGLIVFRERAFLDPGSLWHVRVGEIILTEGFPWTDPFTYTHADHTWIPQQWGGEIVMALAHRAAGFDGMLLLLTTGLAVLSTWLFARMRNAGMSWPLAAAVVGLVFFVGSFHYVVRPHMVTIAFLAWTMGCIIDFDRGRVGLARLAGLIPLFIVWTNIHGGVLAGTMTFGLATAGWFAEGGILRRGPITSRRTALTVGGIVLACGLTPFVNPFGLELLRTWSKLVGSEVLARVMVEHMPLNPNDTSGQVVLGLAAFYLLLFLGTVVARPRSFRLTWLLPFVWFVLTLQAIRQGPLFAIVTGVVIADLWPRTIWHRYLLRTGDTLAVEPVQEPQPTGPPVASWIIPLLAVGMALALQLGGVAVPVLGRHWARITPKTVPIELNAIIAESIRNAGPNARIYNDANLGGYMIFFHPNQKIFMDDRCELYGDAWMQQYYDVYNYTPEQFDIWAENYGFVLALLASKEEKPSVLERYLRSSPQWREVPGGRGKIAVLFERTAAAD